VEDPPLTNQREQLPLAEVPPAVCVHDLAELRMGRFVQSCRLSRGTPVNGDAMCAGTGSGRTGKPRVEAQPTPATGSANICSMTTQGSASGRFTRAIQQRNLFAAEIALREMGDPSLMLALEYVILLAELRPDKAKVAALRWHGRLELEARTLTLAESQFALAALAALCGGNRDAIGVLRRLLRKVRPTLLPRVG
jgi:hypothetical protein